MKKIALIGFLVAFAYAGFQPPDGMRKFPAANLQMQMKTPQGSITATIAPAEGERDFSL